MLLGEHESNRQNNIAKIRFKKSHLQQWAWDLEKIEEKQRKDLEATVKDIASIKGMLKGEKGFIFKGIPCEALNKTNLTN